tara:strand:- start:231 stop:650 length:420 start_codon:yes stop_codon:yes gene_type:complete
VSLLSPFHLAIPVNNLQESKFFYSTMLNCSEGRSSDTWVDYDFFGHQLVIHLDESIRKKSFNCVDGENVPIPHFGVVLKWNDWCVFRKDLESKNIDFIIQPYIRFEGQIGEQATMFFLDPSGNALEFKSFKNMSQLFAN